MLKAILVILAAAGSTQAQLSIAMRPILNPGSGGVNTVYRVGTYEITNEQYTAFLNAVADTDTYSVYDTRMNSDLHGGISRSGSSGSYTYSTKTDFEDKPVNFVSWIDAARFVNWIENGQPTGAQGSGTTEDGAYTLDPDGCVSFTTVTRNNGARWFLPTLAEWKKAAKWDNSQSKFWVYATKSDSTPTSATATSGGDVSNPGSNVVNYNGTADWNGSTSGNVTTVGSCTASSYYGTFDQHGNVNEWLDNLVQDMSAHGREYIGGVFSAGIIPLFNNPLALVGTCSSLDGDTTTAAVGFRIASLCRADFDGDGDVDEDDFDAFDYAFDHSDMDADFNGDGVLNINDFIAYNSAYNAGC